MVLTALLVAMGLGAGPQVPPPPPPPPVYQGPARDPGRRPPPEIKGTGIIRGRVVAADTGTPIRRATVNLSFIIPPRPAGSTTGTTAAPQGLPVTTTRVTTTLNGTQVSSTTASSSFNFRPKTATTDAQGAFEFRELPPGTYRLMASPGPYSAAYLGTAFGAKKPNGPGSIDTGTPIELSDGEAFDKATIGVMRGAVITGRVSDENGEPLARVQVYPILFTPGSARGMRNSGGTQTDDLGQFRLFGLIPGEYVVAAEARGNSYVPPDAPPETEEERIGFMTTFYPGTADDSSAQRVRTRSGVETPGIEIRMVSGRLFHISGMVTDSQGRTSQRANGTLYKRPAGSGASTFGFSTDERGRFQMRNVPPGNYRLTVRLQPPPGARPPDGSQPEQGEFSTIPVSLTADMDDILLVTSPGAAISGTIVLEGTAESSSTQPMRVNAMQADPDAMIGMPNPQGAVVKPDLTFTMKGFAGEYLLRAGVTGYYLKSVTLGAEDITDTPREFKNGDRVTITVTSRAAEIQGTVTDDAGKPTSEAGLLVFSDDKAFWRSTSIRTRRVGPDSTGHYRIQGLLPGRYIVVAAPRERLSPLGMGNDPSLFEALAKEGTTVVVGEDEQRQVDVRVTAGGGGD